MARIHSDLLNIATGLWGMIPNNQMKLSITMPVISAVLTLGSGFSNKAIRWITRDQTSYVSWNDLPGQIDRLAKERFDTIRGALAPAAIYDRNDVSNRDLINTSITGLSILKDKGVILFGGTVLLGIAALSFQNCNLVGDPADPSKPENCWNHLGQHVLEPRALSTLAFGYTMSSMSPMTILFSLAPLVPSLMIVKYLSNGFTNKKLPTFLLRKDLLLKDRYQALATNFAEQWKKAVDSKNAEKKKEVANLAQMIQRKNSLITLALEEFFNLSKEDSINTLKPLIQAANQIIEDSAKETINNL